MIFGLFLVYIYDTIQAQPRQASSCLEIVTSHVLNILCICLLGCVLLCPTEDTDPGISRVVDEHVCTYLHCPNSVRIA